MNIGRIAPFLSLLGLILLLAGGPGTRYGLWEFPFGFQMMRYALYLGAAGAVLGVIFALIPATRRNMLPGLIIAIVVGIGVAAVPIQIRNTARNLPAIHDITTDTVNPPEFVAIRPLRADAPNPPDYLGPEIAQQQRAAYPDIQPLETGLAPAELFGHALDAAREQDWEIVAAEAGDGRIEATATTFWYGFKDDVVIRIRPTPSGSRLDIRSKSRVGRSDLGANAERIRQYLSDLEDRLAAL
ncbi:MAG: DUF1499 domain-containing protein [Wenzhouxiangellaceae bacterium]|nr:DUF1499 domain-containing protein [Wenzhouxiangellaceae bacterium]